MLNIAVIMIIIITMATATATIMRIAIMARCNGDAPNIEIVNAAALPLLWG
jgi:hypothetical protein